MQAMANPMKSDEIIVRDVIDSQYALQQTWPTHVTIGIISINSIKMIK